MAGYSGNLKYSFIFSERQAPFLASGDRSFGWLKEELARMHGNATASQVHIFSIEDQNEVREPLSLLLSRILGSKLYWKVVFDGHVIGQDVSNSFESVMAALDQAVPVQGPQGAVGRDVEILSELRGSSRSALSKLFECYLTWKIGVLEEETLGLGRRIRSAASPGVANLSESFSNYIESQPEVKELLEAFQKMDLRGLRSFLSSYAQQIRAGSDIVAGAVNLARACIDLVDAMKLQEQSKKTYDEIVGFIKGSLQAVVFGMRSLSVLVDRIYRSVTQQHADLNQLKERQVLFNKYDQTSDKIIASLQAMERWFVAQEEALHGLKDIHDERNKAAHRSAWASGVATAFNVVTFFNAAGGLCKIAAGFSAVQNGVSLAMDIVTIFNFLPEARKQVDKALMLVKNGKTVVVDIKKFLAEKQGWHAHSNVIRGVLEQEFRDKEKALVDFLWNELSHQVIVPDGGDAIEKAFQELTEVQARALPVLHIRMGGA